MSAWAGGSTLPVTSWRDGHLVYVSATPMPLTAEQAMEVAERLIEHAQAIQAQRALAPVCDDCDPTPAPCTCEIAEPLIGRAHGVCHDCGGPADNSVCTDCLMQRGA